ncbi:hypothetical protein [Hydrogenophaga sp. 5NK40-0174]|uniref:hypothetical protein n=1 Tax=Hydrogenophaga sp. 5NK40-0174 TaxID=3127649 RepID=UPI00333E5E67
MAGVLLILALIASADLAVQRNKASLRGLAFIVLTGGAAVIMSGLPSMLWPGVSDKAWLLLKVSMGPLSGALALSYLGIWLDEAHEDANMRRMVTSGSMGLVMAAIALALMTVSTDAITGAGLIALAAVVNLLSAALAFAVALRGARLGDRLARWMVYACVSLAVMVAGLYSQGLGLAPLGLAGKAITALTTVGYFLVVIVLTILRTREQRRLRRMARGIVGREVDIPMAQGAALIPRVEDAIWRSQRMQQRCVVAAVSVRNLYEHGELVPNGSETKILSVLAARIRRLVGFRNVVGLYHPRCFVLAVSSGQDPKRGELKMNELLSSLREPVPLTIHGEPVRFMPCVGMGVVPVDAPSLSALDAINQAEKQSFNAPGMVLSAVPSNDEPQDAQDTMPPSMAYY